MEILQIIIASIAMISSLVSFSIAVYYLGYVRGETAEIERQIEKIKKGDE